MSQRLMVMVLVSFLGSSTLWAGVNVWTSLGPEGGSIQALAIDPQESRTVYAVTGGGIYKSTDGAANWRRVYPAATSDGTGCSPVSVLAIDPQNTNTLYAGTGGGVFKSTDGGQSWNATDLIGMTINALAIDP